MITTFTKKLSVDAGFSPEFFFNRIFTAGGMRFHVSVMDKVGVFCHFTMVDKNGQWRIVNAPKLPDWIMSIENKLHNIIIQSILS